MSEFGHAAEKLGKYFPSLKTENTQAVCMLYLHSSAVRTCDKLACCVNLGQNTTSVKEALSRILTDF